MRNVITKWEEYDRDDLNMIPTMIANGFTPEFCYGDKRVGRTTPENPPHNTVKFIKGNLHVWKCYKNSIELWHTAELIDGYYCNLIPVNDLTDLLANHVYLYYDK